MFSAHIRLSHEPSRQISNASFLRVSIEKVGMAVDISTGCTPEATSVHGALGSMFYTMR